MTMVIQLGHFSRLDRTPSPSDQSVIGIQIFEQIEMRTAVIHC